MLGKTVPVQMEYVFKELEKCYFGVVKGVLI